MEKKKHLMWFSHRGQVLQSVLILSIVVLAAGTLGTFTIQQAKRAKKKKQDIEFGIQIQTGIETMLLAYRYQELRYIEALEKQGCEIAQPFLTAIKTGSACATSAGPKSFSLKVFDVSQNVAPTAEIFSYVGDGCIIESDKSSCNTNQLELVNIGIGEANKGQIVGGAKYQFYLNTIFPEKSIAEFIASVELEGSSNRIKRSFAVRPVLPNAAHLENDGRVTQENPDPLARCQGAQWADFLFFHPESQNCQHFVNLGSGTGLGYYKSRYFGFRPFDGQVIDMFLASDPNQSKSYLVGENGKIDGEPLFPCYKKDQLINVDDVTLVGEQIYYVAHSGASAHIGVLDNRDCSGTFDRIKVCKLGEMGWAQAYVGIGALTWSDTLLPRPGYTSDEKNKRMAYFFLKSDAGDLFTAVVHKKKNTAATPSETDFDCFVFKDLNLQQVEYKRTLGFDRTSDSKPYFIY